MIKRFKQLIIDAGVAETNVTAHGLRHTDALFNLERSGSIEQTKAMLGHVSIKSTLVYQAYLDRLNNDAEQQIESMRIHEKMALEDAFLLYISSE